MNRSVIDQLVAWKNSPRRKPLILLGARQVGKTYTLQAFGREHYRHVAYINCDDNDEVRNLFVPDYNIDRILLSISAITGVPVVAGETLIILDEIQELPRGLTALKYFCERAPQHHVCVAGSLLGITLAHGESYPVGKVDTMRMFPMTFAEFLAAKGKQTMADLLARHDWDTLTGLHPMYVQALREYYFVGGMPEAVSVYLQTNDATSVRRVQTEILSAYRNDIAKHTTDEQSKRIAQVWQSMPSQLAKENKKFIYGVVKQGGRAREFELAIQWLVDAGLLLRVGRVTAPSMPLKGYEDHSVFKLFLLDVGLLGAMADIPPALLLLPNDMREVKGMFTENYVCTQLVASCGKDLFYYSKENSSLEIDFLLQDGSRIVPVEAKAEENLKSKSLTALLQAYPALHGMRFSMSPYREQDTLTNVPLYACGAYFETKQL